jgi:hypothetical protein
MREGCGGAAGSDLFLSVGFPLSRAAYHWILKMQIGNCWSWSYACIFFFL